MPFCDDLLLAKMGVLETSWQRNVQRFLTSLSEGLERTVEPGEEQMSMKAAMDLADRAWRSTSSSVYRRSQHTSIRRRERSHLDAVGDAPNDRRELRRNDSQRDHGSSEGSKDLSIVLRLGRVVVADSGNNLALAFLERRQSRLVRSATEVRDERVKALRDLMCLLDPEDGSKRGKLVGGDLALLCKGGVESLAVGLDPLEDEAHLGVGRRRIGLEEGEETWREEWDERRAFDERLLRGGSRVQRGRHLFDDGRREESSQRRLCREPVEQLRAECRDVTLRSPGSAAYHRRVARSTHLQRPRRNQRPNRHRPSHSSPHHRFQRDEGEILRQDRLVDVMNEPSLPAEADFGGPEEGNVDRESNRRREDREPVRDVRMSVAVDPLRVLASERKAGRPILGSRLPDLEPLLDDKVLEEETEEAVVGPAVVDGGEAEEDEDGVEDGEADGGDGVAEEGEESRDELGERVAA